MQDKDTVDVEQPVEDKLSDDETKPEPEKVDGWYCPSCEKGWEDSDELEPIYECGSCGSIFNRDNSADGGSNRCPDCNKFAAKLYDHGCPDCGDIECEEGEIVKGEDDEWKMAEDGD